ncbi:hypothetical protein [Nocardia salmonicida]|uniref:hypothetical protein n=1 Tax=Nocardia salmonicida TaxID=53431 RepID=UPI0033D42BAE
MLDGSPLTPRITRTPDQPGDIFDRQLTRATSDKATHDYFMDLLKFARSTLERIVVAFVVAGATLAMGIAAAVYLAGTPLSTAVGVGTLGGTTGAVFGALKLRKVASAALARHKLPVNDDPATPPEPDPVADRAP